MSQDCLVGYGSNLGDSDGCYSAICSIWKSDPRFDSVVASSLLTTEPVGSSADQNQYRNGSIRFRFADSIDELFATLIAVEEKFGRLRRERWGARTVDLDLLLFGDAVVDTDSLQIPHPRMSFRRFVLRPASQIAAEMVNPVSGLTITQHLELLDSRPNRIAFITTNAASLEESIRNDISSYAQAGWQFQFISEAQQIHSDQQEIKLLVYFRDLPTELIVPARGFRGATLDASTDSGTVDLSELAAAIEAMSSL